ncbi:MAG: alpha/beta hydrolase [bacterium]|nr:alpha/beta hydrolase [bacterium]
MRPRLAIPASILAVLLLAVPAIAGTVTAPDGVVIHYTDQGQGSPALVFVHGWSCDATYWDAQVAHFAAKHRVVVIDLAGHGASGQERKAYTMEAFGADVAAVLAQLDLKDTVLVGHSMGGAVIVEAALAAPDRVLGLVGVDNFQDVGMKLPPEAIDGFVSTFEADFTPRVRAWVGHFFPAGADSALAAGIAADMASAPPAVGLSAMRELLHWFGDRTTERLAQLKVPMMCINADAQPTKVEPIKALVPGFQLRVMAGRGHFVMREDPDGFNRLLGETVGALMAP